LTASSLVASTGAEVAGTAGATMAGEAGAASATASEGDVRACGGAGVDKPRTSATPMTATSAITATHSKAPVVPRVYSVSFAECDDSDAECRDSARLRSALIRS
jgi:hypothetical protein